MEFPYFILPGDPINTPRPLIPVIFKYKKIETKPILTLIDSGADYSFLSLKIASYLGIKFSGIKPIYIRGFNNTQMGCFPIETSIVVGERMLTFPIYYGGEINKEYQSILGQDFFFDKAKITFERYKWSVSIDWVKKVN